MLSQLLPIDAAAPEFDLPGVDGQRHALAAWRGRAVLLLFYRGHW
jgi:peroxiredoxin